MTHAKSKVNKNTTVDRWGARTRPELNIKLNKWISCAFDRIPHPHRSQLAHTLWRRNSIFMIFCERSKRKCDWWSEWNWDTKKKNECSHSHENRVFLFVHAEWLGAWLGARRAEKNIRAFDFDPKSIYQSDDLKGNEHWTSHSLASYAESRKNNQKLTHSESLASNWIYLPARNYRQVFSSF